MSKQITSQAIAKELLDQLEETFEQVKGIYLDRGTSMLETLSTLSAAEASRPMSGNGTSIAGQVAHVRFYLKALIDYMAGNKNQKLDWKQSWLVKEVNETEWKVLQEGIRSDYQQIRDSWKSDRDWAADDQLGGAIAIIAHTAYHLGAIRQILHVVKQ